MTTIVGDPVVSSAGQPWTVTVPDGVTANMTVLLAWGRNDAGDPLPSVAGPPGSVWREVDGRPANNMFCEIYAGQGVEGGDTIEIGSGASLGSISLLAVYTDEWMIPDPATVAAGTRGGVSSPSTTTGPLTPAVGQRVLVVGMERTTADSTAITSVVSSGGEVVDQIAFSGASADPDPDVSVYIGGLTADTADEHMVTITYSGGSGNGLAVLVPLDGVQPPDVGATVRYTAEGGVVATGAVYVVGEVGPERALEMRAVPTGYADVASMLVTPGFAVAHRGGTDDWPECSMRAYTQSVVWGAGALEVPVARTSDGVLIAQHDQTLDRLSGTTGVDPATLTWAQLSAYQISQGIPPGEAPQPYMRLDDLIDAYAGSHVLLVDPKYLTTPQRADLLDRLDQIPSATERIIWKFYGVSTIYAPPATARGYTTWGYFYQSDGDVSAYVGQWDLLGMDRNADPATWATTIGYGKPVIGHVCYSRAEADYCLTQGAAGLMAAAVTDVIPRA